MTKQKLDDYSVPNRIGDDGAATETLRPSKRPKNGHRDGTGGGRSFESKTIAVDARSSKSSTKTSRHQKKRKLRERKEVEGEENVMRRKLAKKKKDPSGRDVAGKLDMLIEDPSTKWQ